jgi:predicted nuclease with TOPRIM domain
MERMKHTGDYELDEINMLEQECADLEEENKRLEEENKKLKDKIKRLEFDVDAWHQLKLLLEREIEKLR